jgi:hypothetical protein
MHSGVQVAAGSRKMVWAGLYLRDDRVRALITLRQ